MNVSGLTKSFMIKNKNCPGFGAKILYDRSDKQVEDIINIDQKVRSAVIPPGTYNTINYMSYYMPNNTTATGYCVRNSDAEKVCDIIEKSGAKILSVDNTEYIPLDDE